MDSTNEQVYFTLDNGVTKFYDLLQLVEFHQLNAGCLPTRLMHYVVQVPVTKWNLHEHNTLTTFKQFLFTTKYSHPKGVT